MTRRKDAQSCCVPTEMLGWVLTAVQAPVEGWGVAGQVDSGGAAFLLD